MCTIKEFKDRVNQDLQQSLEEEQAHIQKYKDEGDQIEYWETGVDPTKENKEVVVCFTGRRPKDLAGYVKENYDVLFFMVVDKLKELINKYHEQHPEYNFNFKFITGGAQGFDQLVFWAVNKLKEDNTIQNIVYVPFTGQEKKWQEQGLFSQAEYNLMLKKADDVLYLEEELSDYSAIVKALYNRNHKMVDDSNIVIALYPDDTWNENKKSGTAECMRYASSMNKRLWQWKYTVNNNKVILL